MLAPMPINDKQSHQRGWSYAAFFGDEILVILRSGLLLQGRADIGEIRLWATTPRRTELLRFFADRCARLGEELL